MNGGGYVPEQTAVEDTVRDRTAVGTCSINIYSTKAAGNKKYAYI